MTHFSNVFIYFTSLHVSSNPVLIIRRINCINTSSVMYHSAHHQENRIVSIHHLACITLLIIRRIELYQYIIWHVSLCVRDCLVCRSFGTGIPGSHLHRVIHARWCIDTIDSPDDEHWVARNMQRSKINKYIEKSASSWLLTRIICDLLTPAGMTIY